VEQENAIPPGPTDFDRADIPATAATTCAAGQHPLTATYYTVNGRAICETCREQLQKEMGKRGSFGAALMYGAAAAVVGAAIYYAIVAATGLEIGLVSIVVGIIVGKAVRRGAGARAGWHYRALALVLTYMAITATYVPIVLKEASVHSVLAACFVALILPGLMLMNFENILGLAILGFGLYEAYKLSAPPRLMVEGPFTNQAASPPAPSPSAQPAAPV
jgi:hypothetical protein